MKRINIIGISGRAGSGKDTVAEMIRKMLFKEHWEIKKFSGKLKKIASILTGIPEYKFEDRKFKDSFLSNDWDYYTIDWENFSFDGDENNVNEIKVKYTVRDFLVTLGIKGLRCSVHEDVLINALWIDYKNDYESKWIISDVRFLNEVKYIKENGGIVIRLTKNEDVKSSCRSEIELDNFQTDFDYIIDNKNKSIKETYIDVKKMLEYYNLI